MSSVYALQTVHWDIYNRGSASTQIIGLWECCWLTARRNDCSPWHKMKNQDMGEQVEPAVSTSFQNNP